MTAPVTSRSRAPKALLAGVEWLLWGCLLVVSVILVGMSSASLVGLHALIVYSGSMEPAIPTGSMVLVAAAEPADLRVGR